MQVFVLSGVVLSSFELIVAGIVVNMLYVVPLAVGVVAAQRLKSKLALFYAYIIFALSAAQVIVLVFTAIDWVHARSEHHLCAPDTHTCTCARSC